MKRREKVIVCDRTDGRTDGAAVSDHSMMMMMMMLKRKCQRTIHELMTHNLFVWKATSRSKPHDCAMAITETLSKLDHTLPMIMEDTRF